MIVLLLLLCTIGIVCPKLEYIDHDQYKHCQGAKCATFGLIGLVSFELNSHWMPEVVQVEQELFDFFTHTIILLIINLYFIKQRIYLTID